MCYEIKKLGVSVGEFFMEEVRSKLWHKKEYRLNTLRGEENDFSLDPCVNKAQGNTSKTFIKWGKVKKGICEIIPLYQFCNLSFEKNHASVFPL